MVIIKPGDPDYVSQYSFDNRLEGGEREDESDGDADTVVEGYEQGGEPHHHHHQQHHPQHHHHPSGHFHGHLKQPYPHHPNHRMGPHFHHRPGGHWHRGGHWGFDAGNHGGWPFFAGHHHMHGPQGAHHPHPPFWHHPFMAGPPHMPPPPPPPHPHHHRGQGHPHHRGGHMSPWFGHPFFARSRQFREDPTPFRGNMTEDEKLASGLHDLRLGDRRSEPGDEILPESDGSSSRTSAKSDKVSRLRGYSV